MSKSATKATLSIGVRLFSAFLFSCLLISVVAVGLHFYHSQKLAKDSSLRSYQYTAAQIAQRTEQNKLQMDEQLTALSNSQMISVNNRLTPSAITRFAQILNQQTRYQSLSVGFKNGNLQKLVALDKPQSAQYIHQVKQAKWLLVSIQKNATETIREELYFDNKFHFLSKFQEITTGDITTSEWYKAAQQVPLAITSQTEKNLTYSKKINKINAVIAIETKLADYSEALKDISSPDLHNELYLFTNKGHLLATSNAEKWQSPLYSPYPLLMDLIDSKTTDQLTQIEIEKQHYYAYLTPLEGETNAPSYLAFLTPKQALLLPSIKTSLEILLACLALSILLSWLFTVPISKALTRLIHSLEAAKSNNYKKFTPKTSRFRELNSLNITIAEMSEIIAEQNIKHQERASLFASLNAKIIDNKALNNNNQINRYPTLTGLLGIAASKSHSPEFSTFTLSNETAFNHFQAMAWTHLYQHLNADDLVNKGTKLDTPYNRIHEIRMRFEVLWRDAEIHYYQESRANPEQNKPLKEKLIKQQLQLMRDFEFVAKLNQGHTSLSPQDHQRLQQMSEKTWLRYFDNSLGLSAVEAINLAMKKQKLPATEYLINHELTSQLEQPSTTNNALTHGNEFYQLSIQQGTATVEQAQEAKQQLSSIKNMLNALSNAESQSTVIDLSMYHSRLTAIAYPKSSTQVDLSIAEHIMFLSDIFIALTTIKSPVKATLSLSQAIDVLYQITMDKHLNLAIFRLFLSSGTYLQYAQQYLHASQIDSVNIEQYLKDKD